MLLLHWRFKGIQKSLGFWIARSGFRIPLTMFQIPKPKIPDPQVKIPAFWIPEAKFAGFRNPESLTLDK